MTKQKEQTKFYWHIHHDRLMEALTEPIENRISYIMTKKPENERKLRLRLLKPVKGKLPDDVVKVGKAYSKAIEAYSKSGKAYSKAREAYVKVLEKHKEEIKKLHKKECPDCPWNGRSIFR